jgi:hypothetical protein
MRQRSDDWLECGHNTHCRDMKNMKIVAIQKPTQSDEVELKGLKEASKHRPLTDKEKDRVVFLGMKQLWNCEC